MRKLFVLGAACLIGACGRPYDAATPEGFVDLGEDRYENGAEEYRASTADGVVLGTRAWENDPKVDLELAVRALENRVRFGQGYALLDKKEVQARNGLKGTQMRFGHDEANGSHIYYLTVFVDDDWVYLLEAGGKKDLIEKAAPSIEWAVKNFAP